MGIQIQAKLIYGVKYKDLAEEDLEEIDELLDNGELDYACPFYNAPRGHWVIGCEVYAAGQWDVSEMMYEMSFCEEKLPVILVKNYNLGFYVKPHVT